MDRKKQHTERNVFQCLVFGPKKAGKSGLLNSLLGRCKSKSIYANTSLLGSNMLNFCLCPNLLVGLYGSFRTL